MSMIVNLYGGPGTGKSTTMATIFSLMKMRGASVEMAPEWVKIPIWAGETHILEDQLYIFAKQNHILRRLDGKVDFVITDSPLLMSMVYCDEPHLNALVRHTVRNYRNIHVFLDRVKPYYPAGRVQDEQKARALDREIREMMRREIGTTIHVLDADYRAHLEIVNYIA